VSRISDDAPARDVALLCGRFDDVVSVFGRHVSGCYELVTICNVPKLEVPKYYVYLRKCRATAVGF